MKKIIMESDSIIIDGVELSYNEIQELLIDRYKFRDISNFLRTNFNKVGVSDE